MLEPLVVYFLPYGSLSKTLMMKKNETIETLATKLAHLGEQYKDHHALLFMYYYENIIEPVCKFQLSDVHIPHDEECTNDDQCKVCEK